MTEEYMNHISQIISKQKGRKFPVSNQIVCCGYIVENEEKWNSFCESLNKHIIKRQKHTIYLDNGEIWHFIKIGTCFKGFRFYKAKISKTISDEYFHKVIYPCCTIYCCNIEWI